MTRSIQVLLAAALLLSLPAFAADKPAQKRYPLPDKRGTFSLSAPSAWKDEVRQPPQPGLPPTIVFTPATGKAFQVMVTPIWKPSPDVPTPTNDALRQYVQHAADELKNDRVEKEVKVVEVKGKAGTGYYFSATDKSPQPDEFKFLTQGLLMVSELMVTFTILTNDGQEQVVRDGLAMVRSAAHSAR